MNCYKKIKEGKYGLGGITVAILVAVVFLFIDMIILSSLTFRTGTFKRSVKELDIINAINIIENTKLSLTDAVAYSTYKASKDVLDTAGFCSKASQCEENCKIDRGIPTLNCVPYWRVYNTLYAPTYEEFIDNLKTQLSSRFEEYSKEFNVAPSYCPINKEDLVIEDEDGKIFVQISNKEEGTTKPLKYEGNFFEISDNGAFSDTVNIKTLEMFSLAESLFFKGDAIKSAFDNAEKDLPIECRKIEIGDKCKNEIKCKELLLNNCPDVENSYEESVRSNIDNIGKAIDGIEINVQIRDCLETGVKTSYDYSEKISSYEGCDCIKWVVECDGTALSCNGLDESTCNSQKGCSFFKECIGGSECIGIDNEEGCSNAGCEWVAECRGDVTSCDSFDKICLDGEKTSCTKSYNDCISQSGCIGTMSCEDRYDLYKDVKCVYDYFGSSSVDVEIKDTNQYPIEDSLENLYMKFYVVSGDGGNKCSVTTTEDAECKS